MDYIEDDDGGKDNDGDDYDDEKSIDGDFFPLNLLVVCHDTDEDENENDQ